MGRKRAATTAKISLAFFQASDQFFVRSHWKIKLSIVCTANREDFKTRFPYCGLFSSAKCVFYNALRKVFDATRDKTGGLNSPESDPIARVF